MHVRAASAQVWRGKIQELIDIYNNPIIRSFRRLKGFKSAYLMTDVGSHTALSVTAVSYTHLTLPTILLV